MIVGLILGNVTLPEVFIGKYEAICDCACWEIGAFSCWIVFCMLVRAPLMSPSAAFPNPAEYLYMLLDISLTVDVNELGIDGGVLRVCSRSMVLVGFEV